MPPRACEPEAASPTRVCRDVSRSFPSSPQGVVRSELVRDIPTELSAILAPLAFPLTKSPAQGAATSTFAALAPTAELSAGGYYAECRLTQPTGNKGVARDAETARKLWELSEALVAGAESKRAAFGAEEALPAVAGAVPRTGVTYV